MGAILAALASSIASYRLCRASNVMTIEKGNSSDAYLKRAFTWLTRTGAGRKFGSLPIGWYQMHQMAALNILEQRCDGLNVRCKQGHIQAKQGGTWHTVMSAIELFQSADSRARKNEGLPVY